MNKSAAYTAKEKILLAQLVRENEAVENKKTDATTLEQKAKAWELITNAYNSQPEVSNPRSSSQLKKLWNNLKQRKRKQTTEERYDMLLTGGGPPKKPTPDPVLDSVEDAAPNMDITILCPWDSTAAFEIHTHNTNGYFVELAEATKLEVPKVPKLDFEILSSCKYSAGPSSVKREGSPSASVNPSTGIDKERSKKTNLPAVVFTERNARIQKLQEAIEQQRELHGLRKKIIEEEREFYSKKAQLELRKAEDEAELVSLKLAEYKLKMDN